MLDNNLGPEKTIEFYSPRYGFRAFLIIDNTALGPAIGGVRVSKNLELDEVRRLARTMTLKNSIAGIPHGGGKAGIKIDPGSSEKEKVFRWFARMIEKIDEYIPGPDMGSDETCMAWVYDEIKRAVGLPEEIGGLPLDKLGAKGFGIVECAMVAARYLGIELNNSRVVIQGYGSVGRAVARFISERSARIVAVSDSKGTIFNPDGIDVNILDRVKNEKKSVVFYPDGERMPLDEIFTIDCDVLVPAATPDVINMKNVDRIRTKLIIEGANIPITEDAEDYLFKKGILFIPDFVANAGGVIMASMEYAKKREREAFEVIKDKIRKNTEIVLGLSLKEDVNPRLSAIKIAKERILMAMNYRDM